MKMMYNKKGQATGAVAAMITLIVGSGVAVMVLIFVGVLSGQAYNIVEPELLGIGNTTQINYTATASNTSAVYLGHTDIHSGSLIILNQSNNQIPLGNFTIDYTAGTALLKTTGLGAYNGVSIQASYNWGNLEIQDHVFSSIKSGFGALEQVGDFLPLIILAIVISIVLFLILSFTAFGNMGGSNTAL